jgi:hypothetical protein
MQQTIVLSDIHSQFPLEEIEKLMTEKVAQETKKLFLGDIIDAGGRIEKPEGEAEFPGLCKLHKMMRDIPKTTCILGNHELTIIVRELKKQGFFKLQKVLQRQKQLRDIPQQEKVKAIQQKTQAEITKLQTKLRDVLKIFYDFPFFHIEEQEDTITIFTHSPCLPIRPLQILVNHQQKNGYINWGKTQKSLDIILHRVFLKDRQKYEDHFKFHNVNQYYKDNQDKIQRLLQELFPEKQIIVVAGHLPNRSKKVEIQQPWQNLSILLCDMGIGIEKQHPIIPLENFMNNQ